MLAVALVALVPAASAEAFATPDAIHHVDVPGQGLFLPAHVRTPGIQIRGECGLVPEPPGCSGAVCFTDPSQGATAVTLGDSGQGTVGFGIRLPQGRDQYGPYTGVFVSYTGYGC
jgi:hypothetical protein